MRLEELGLRLDWTAPGFYYFASGLPETIAGGATRSYGFTLHIPAGITNNTLHLATVYILAADPGVSGGWGSPTSKTVDYNFPVCQPSTTACGFVSLHSAGMDGPIVLIPFISVLVFFVILAVLLSREDR